MGKLQPSGQPRIRLADTPTVFLSASVPEPERLGGRYVAATVELQELDRTRIRESILALVSVCREYDLALVFGGHPAISPLVDHASRSLGNRERIRIYQSQHFAGRMPRVALEFPGLVLTDRMEIPAKSGVNAETASRDASIQEMRRRMIEEFEGHYVAAVFIGGMNGIDDEFEWFRRRHNGAVCLPITSTGGATRVEGLLERVLPDEHLSDQQRRLLIMDAKQPDAITYRSLFRRLLINVR